MHCFYLIASRIPPGQFWGGGHVFGLCSVVSVLVAVLDNKQQTTNNRQQTTNNEEQTTSNTQQTTNNKQQQTTNNKQHFFFIPPGQACVLNVALRCVLRCVLLCALRLWEEMAPKWLHNLS